MSKKIILSGRTAIQISLNPKDNLVPGPRPINISDEVWEDIKNIPGVELYEEEPTPKPAKAKKTKEITE